MVNWIVFSSAKVKNLAIKRSQSNSTTFRHRCRLHEPEEEESILSIGGSRCQWIHLNLFNNWKENKQQNNWDNNLISDGFAHSPGLLPGFERPPLLSLLFLSERTRFDDNSESSFHPSCFRFRLDSVVARSVSSFLLLFCRPRTDKWCRKKKDDRES